MSKDEIINNVTSGKSFLNNFELDFYLNDIILLLNDTFYNFTFICLYLK